MITRTLTLFERDGVRNFYLALSADDRHKRFCSPLSDEVISKYVDGLDFTQHTILGAYNECAQIIGLAELAPGAEASELAFAVRPDLRGQGIATRLMQRLLLRARMCGIRQVMVMFLSDNAPMRKLAVHAGMRVESDRGECFASRELPAPGAGELNRWLFEEIIAHGEYFCILGMKRWVRLCARHVQQHRRTARRRTHARLNPALRRPGLADDTERWEWRGAPPAGTARQP